MQRSGPGTQPGRQDASAGTPGIDRDATGTRRVAASTAGSTDGEGPLLSFFIPDLTVGGAEQVTVNIVNGLAARGYRVELLLSRYRGELKPNLAADVEVVTLPPERTAGLGVAAHLPAIVSYLRNRNPDVLIPHLAHPSVVCLAINRALDVEAAVVPTHHSAFGQYTEQTAKDRVVDTLVPRLYPAADRIIAVSEGVANSIVERTPVEREDISVLHNPVDVHAVREQANEPVDHEWVEDDDVDVVLFVGRLAGQKDLDTWVRTFERVHERNPDTRAVIAGQGPYREELEGVVERSDAADAISLPGFVENPFRYMGQADVFFLSSRYEGLPTVLIEALACGCPVVATDCPSGPREILADGTYGRLAPVGDPRRLADAVTETLEDPPAEGLLRGRADDFAPESVFTEYERFIDTYVV